MCNVRLYAVQATKNHSKKLFTLFMSFLMISVIPEDCLGSELAKFAITSMHTVKNISPKLRIPTHIIILSFILKMKCIMFLCLHPVKILLSEIVITPSLSNKIEYVFYGPYLTPLPRS